MEFQKELENLSTFSSSQNFNNISLKKNPHSSLKRHALASSNDSRANKISLQQILSVNSNSLKIKLVYTQKVCIFSFKELLGRIMSLQVFSDVSTTVKGIIEGQKTVIDFLGQKLKDRLQCQASMEEKVDNLTKKIYEKCCNCGEQLEKKNLEKLKTGINMGFKDPYTYFMMDFEEINRMEEEARLFLMKRNTQLHALTEEQYILKLQDMHENMQKTMYGIDRCLTDILKFQQKVIEMNDSHQEARKLTKVATANLFSHKKFAFNVGVHFCDLIRQLERKLKQIMSRVIYKAHKGIQTFQNEDYSINPQNFEKIKKELELLKNQNKEINLHKNSIEQKFSELKLRYKVSEEQKKYLEEKLQLESKTQKSFKYMRTRQQILDCEDKLSEKCDQRYDQRFLNAQPSTISKEFSKKSKEEKENKKIDKEEEEEIQEDFVDEGIINTPSRKNFASTIAFRNPNQSQYMSRNKNLYEMKDLKDTEAFKNNQKEKKNAFKSRNSVEHKKKSQKKITIIENKLQNEDDDSQVEKQRRLSINLCLNQIINRPEHFGTSKKKNGLKKIDKKSQIISSDKQSRFSKSIIERVSSILRERPSKRYFIDQMHILLKEITEEQKVNLSKNHQNQEKKKDQLSVLLLKKQQKRKSNTKSIEEKQNLLDPNKKSFPKPRRSIIDIQFSKTEEKVEKPNNEERRISTDFSKNLKIPDIRQNKRKQTQNSFGLSHMYSKTANGFKRNSQQVNAHQQLLSDNINSEEFSLSEKDFRFLFVSKEKALKILNEKNQKKSLNGNKNLFEEGLEKCEIIYSNQLFSYIANIHLQDKIKYNKIKDFLLNPTIISLNEDGGKRKVKQNSPNLIKENIQKLLIMHRQCTVQGTICKHLLYFLEKIKRQSLVK